MSTLQLDPHRALPFPAEQRSIAWEIYSVTKDLPLICMHGHVEPEVFADDIPFADPAQLLIVPDHYVFRMLASQGIEPARLGVPRLDGGPVEPTPERSGVRSVRTGSSFAARRRASGWNTS
jgi:glucuronate isomerase